MKYIQPLILTGTILSILFFANPEAALANLDPNAEPGGGGSGNTLGNLQFSPTTVKNGGSFTITLSGGPANALTKLWVNNNDGNGYRDFGQWLTTSAAGTIFANRTLDCINYQTLDPAKNVAVGNRVLIQSVYLEYLGLNKISGTGTHIKDCASSSTTNTTDPTNPPAPAATSNPLFPFTVKSIFGTDYIEKAFPLPTQYASPIKKFAGRYFDGNDSGGSNTALGFEWYTMRASYLGNNNPPSIKTAGNKIYMLMGNTIAAYNKNTFASRLANSGNSSLAVFAGSKESVGYDHGILPWDAYLYPEHKDNAWLIEPCDCHTGINSYDVDDRGYIYFNDRFGFGIARDEGSNMRIIVQVIDGLGGLTFSDGPHTLPWLRTDTNGTIKLTDMGGYGDPGKSGNVYAVKAGGKYYAVFTGGNSTTKRGTRVVDVTDVNNPQYFSSAPDENILTLVQSGDTIAITAGALRSSNSNIAASMSEVRIYSAADFIATAGRNPDPKKVFSAGQNSEGYVGLAGDKTNGKFYSIHYSSSPRDFYVTPTASISVFSPATGGTYTEKKYVQSAESMGGQTSKYIYLVASLDYNNGYLVSRGVPAGSGQYIGTGDIKIWNFQNGEPKELDTKGFFKDYYAIGSNRANIQQAVVETIGGKDYLFVSTFQELADVYELEPGTGSGDPVVTPPPPIATSTPPVDNTEILNQPCATTFAGNSALIGLCQQIKFVQQRSCNLVPGLSFCSGFKESQ